MSSTSDYRSWPAPARSMARAVEAAVGAARAADGEAFAEALTELDGLDREQLAVLLGSITRELVELSYPDGLDSAGADELLKSCVRFAAAWYPALDVNVLIHALMGTLGITDPDETFTPSGPSVVAHGLLLIADQLNLHEAVAAPLIESALHELMRAQTMEMP